MVLRVHSSVNKKTIKNKERSMRHHQKRTNWRARGLLTFSFSALLAVTAAFNAVAQESTGPEKVGIVYLMTGDQFVEIPRSTGKKKTAMLITANSKIRMQFKGAKADFVVEGGKSPIFSVLLPSGDTNSLHLYPMSLKKKKREAVIGTGGSIYGESTAGAETLPVDFRKNGEDVFLIEPSTPLKPGEYAFAFAGANEFFCFSVK